MTNAYDDLKTKNPSDAPSYLRGENAGAWAAGYNACVSNVRGRSLDLARGQTLQSVHTEARHGEQLQRLESSVGVSEATQSQPEGRFTVSVAVVDHNGETIVLAGRNQQELDVVLENWCKEWLEREEFDVSDLKGYEIIRKGFEAYKKTRLLGVQTIFVGGKVDVQL